MDLAVHALDRHHMRGPVLLLGSQLPREFELVPHRVVRDAVSVVKPGTVKVIGGPRIRCRAALQCLRDDQQADPGIQCVSAGR